MTGRSFVFSHKKGIRAERHMLYWLIVSVVFFVQASMPVSHFLMIAFWSTILFLPLSIIASYVCIYILLPRFFARKKYAALFFEYLSLILACFIINYLASMLLYRLTNFNRITGFSFRWYFSLAFNNTSHLLAITGLSLGIKAMKSFYISQSEKLLLQREKIRKEGELLKARMYPEVIKQSLTVLSDRVNSGFNGASELLMAVSDVFSYLLYSSNQSVIDIRKELGLIRNIAYLENSMENNSHLISVLVAGDCEGFVIRPLVLFSILQACITLLHRQKGCTIELQFEINIVDRQISVVVEFNSLGDPGDEHFHWSDLIAKHLEGRPAVDNPLYRIGKSAHNGVQIWIDTQKNAFVSHGFAPNTK